MPNPRIVGYIVVSILAAVLITGVTFLVGEGVVAPVPGVAGAGGSATVSGFPIPYATEFCCGIVNGISLNNTYYYRPLNFVADFALWFLISLTVIFTLTFRRFALAAVAGLVVTLLTLLLPPLSIVRPSPGMETSVLIPMGFPYEYLTYYVVGLPGVANPRGYEFAFSPALADYALWTGVAAALVGLAVAVFRRRRAQPSGLNE